MILNPSRNFSKIAIFLPLIFFCCFATAQSTDAEVRPLSTDDWIEDLEFMVDKLKDVHYKPFTNLTEVSFDSMVSQIHGRLPDLSDDAIIMEFAELVAAFGWGHTRINLPVNYEQLGYYQGHKLDKPGNLSIAPFTVLPIRFVQFSDGVFIQSAVEGSVDLLGKQVTRIGEVPVDEALRRMGKYVSHENQSALELQAPVCLSITNFLLRERITAAMNAVTLHFADGTSRTVQPLSYHDRPKYLDVFDLTNTVKPLWLSDTQAGMWQIATPDRFWTEVDQYYWFRHLPERKALYIKINYIAEHPDKSLARFMNEAMAVAHREKVDKVIVDLRHNTGGNGDSNRSIILALQRWPGITEFGSAFVLVGRQTYSAAILLALELEKNANVLFVGEEIGGKPGHIGDSKRFVLPNSQLTVRVSVAKHDDWTGLPDRSSVWLHFPIRLSFAKYRQGIDPCVGFALNYKDINIHKEIVDIYRRTNINVAILILYHLYTDPRATSSDHGAIAHTLASYLCVEEKKIAYSKYITDVSLEYNARYVPLQLLRAKIAIEEEDPESAKAILETILKREPGHREALNLLASLR